MDIFLFNSLSLILLNIIFLENIDYEIIFCNKKYKKKDIRIINRVKLYWFGQVIKYLRTVPDQRSPTIFQLPKPISEVLLHVFFF